MLGERTSAYLHASKKFPHAQNAKKFLYDSFVVESRHQVPEEQGVFGEVYIHIFYLPWFKILFPLFGFWNPRALRARPFTRVLHEYPHYVARVLLCASLKFLTLVSLRNDDGSDNRTNQWFNWLNGWTKKNHRAARAARFWVQFFDVLCGMKFSWNLILANFTDFSSIKINSRQKLFGENLLHYEFQLNL